MGKEQPQPFAPLRLHPPVIARPRPPVGIVHPPFRRDPLRPRRHPRHHLAPPPAEPRGGRRVILRRTHRLGPEQRQGPRPPLRPRPGKGGRPGRRQNLRALLGQMAFPRMKPRHRLGPQPHAQLAQKVVQPPLLRRPAPRRRAAMLHRRQRLGLHRLQPQHVDPETGLQIRQLHPQQGPDPILAVRGAGQPHLGHLHPPIGAERLQPHPPRPPAMAAQPRAQHRQQPLHPRLHIGQQTDGIGQADPGREMQRRACRRHRLRLQPQRLIQPPEDARPEPPRQRGARQHGDILYPAQAQPHQPLHRLRLQPQRRHRQRGQRLPHLPARRDHPARPRLRNRPRPRTHPADRQRPAPFPAPPLGRPRPRRMRLLLDRIPAAMQLHPAPGMARQRPGRPRRIGNRRPQGQAQRLAIRLYLRQQRGLAAEQMRAARQIHHQPRRRLFRHPGAELARPAPQARQEGRIALGIGGHRLQSRADRRRIAQGLARLQPQSLGLGRNRQDHLRPAAIRHDGQRPLRHRQARPAQHTFRRKPREPQGKDAALGHESPFVHTLFLILRPKGQKSSTRSQLSVIRGFSGLLPVTRSLPQDMLASIVNRHFQQGARK